MSTICLPKSILDQFDKVSRDFLWGSKLHAVSWDKVTSPISEGGLGIRNAQDMNKALIAKLGWRLLNDTESLWSTLLRKKYKVGSLQDVTWMKAKSTWSSTWRSIMTGVCEVVLLGQSWVLGNGNLIRFWSDKWLSNIRLRDIAVVELPPGSDMVLVRDMWRNGVGWDFNRIVPYVSERTRLEIMSIVLDNVTGARDRLSWGESVDGSFSVVSAYAMITREDAPRPNFARFYDRVWRVVVPFFRWQFGGHGSGDVILCSLIMANVAIGFNFLRIFLERSQRRA